MSVRQTAEAWKLELPHNEKFVLLALTDHADDDGKRVYPSVAYTAHKTGYGKRQIRRIMARLRARGLIEPVRHRLGGRNSKGTGYATEYWLHLDKGVKTSPYESSASAEDYPVQARVTVEPDQGGPDGPATRTVESGNADLARTAQPSLNHQEPSLEPSGEPSRASARAAPAGGWLHILREIAGWKAKGRKSEGPLLTWVQDKGYSEDDLERSAIGLAKTKTTTLSRYSNLSRAFQNRLLKGYDVAPGVQLPAAPPPVDRPTLAIDRGDEGIWEQALDLLADEVPGPAHKTWLSPTVGMGFAGTCLVVGVDSEAMRDYLEQNIGSLMDRAVQAAAGRSDLSVAIEITA